MFKYLFVLLLFLLPSLSFGQLYINQLLFEGITADTVGTIAEADSVEIQMGYNGPWKLLTKSISDTALITVDDKLAENTVEFQTANESWWGHVPMCRVRIYSTGADTATSKWLNIGRLQGAIGLSIVCDTSGTKVDYGSSKIHGN